MIRAGRAATVGFALTLVIGVATAIAAASHDDLPGHGNNWTDAVAAIVYGALGYVVLRHSPGHGSGRALAVAGLVGSTYTAASWWAAHALVQAPGALPFAGVAAWVGILTGPFTTLTSWTIPMVLFPTGQPRSARWAWFLRTVVAIIALQSIVGAAVAVGPAMHHPIELLDIPGVTPRGAADLAIGLTATAFPVCFLATVAAFVGVVLSARRATPATRVPYRWLLGGVGVFLTVLIGSSVLERVTHVPDGAFTLGLVAVPVAMAVGMVGYRLYDVDIAISRSVGAAVAVTVLGGVYLGTVWIVARAIGADPYVFGPSLAAAAVVMVAFAPVYAFVRGRVDRVLRGRSRTSAVLTVLDPGDEPATSRDLLQQLADAVATELRLHTVTIELDGQVAVSTSGSSGASGQTDDRPGGPPELIDLVHDGVCLGVLRADPRTGERLGRREVRFLRELSGVVAVTAAALRLGDELEQATQQLQQSRREERQRLRRDLHDGLGPSLASLRLRVGTAQAQLGGATSAASAAFDGLRDDIATALREVRRIVDGLQPSVLEDLGLVPAMRLLVEQISDSGLPVTLDAPAALAQPLPVDVVVSIYRITAEAVSNAVRHSHGRGCHVMLDGSGPLVLEVRDDGVGFDVDAAAGVGLQSMRSRAASIGGSLSLTSAPGLGTTLRVEVPG